MKITLDLETSEIVVPKNFFAKIEKENALISAHGGTPVKATDRIKIAFEKAMNETDKYLHVKS